jgi:hypothetical protein
VNEINIQNRVEAWFHEFNRDFFNGKIQNVKKVSAENLLDTEVIGYWDPDCLVIGVESSLTNPEICGVLLHEMIHAWQYQGRGWTNHGEEFSKKKDEIEELTGFDLA